MIALDLPGRTRPYLMAHRGNSARCPENTLAAFRQAFADGADILETDLHLSADGVFVCIHDATVTRTTDGSGAVADLTLDQIKTFSASYGRAGFEAEKIPTLIESMALLPADVALALELKTDRFLEPDVCQRLAAVLDAGGVLTRSVVLSFSIARLKAMRRAAPDIPIGYITLSRPVPAPGCELLGPLWPLLVLNPLYVWTAHRRGQVVCPLDVTPDRRVGLYRRLGCDAIMTNNPASIAPALGKR